MIKLFLITGLFLTTANPVWTNNLETAKQTAKKEHKMILVNFSGSDWCLPCIRLHQEIFNSNSFANYASDYLVLVNVDFPRQNKNKLSKEQQKLNDEMAERYDPNGNFPYTLLLDENGRKLKTWDGFYKNGVQNFIDEIKAASKLN